MPDFSNWGNSVIDAEARAADAWGRIQRDPTSVQFLRNNVLQSAQTVRIEMSNTVRREQNAAGTATVSRQTVIVFGIQDHATLPDTDMRLKDRFFMGQEQYEIQNIVAANGERQGFAERYG